MTEAADQVATLRPQLSEARRALRIVAEIHRRIISRPVAKQILYLRQGGMIPADQLHKAFPGLELAKNVFPGIGEFIDTMNDLFYLYEMNEALFASKAVDGLLAQFESLLDQLKTARPSERPRILERLNTLSPYVQVIAETLRVVRP